jgi:hypothetical protein
MQKFAKINATASGSNTIVPAVANKKIRVLAFTALTDANVTIEWLSNATAISGPMPILASGGMATSIGQLGTGGHGVFGLMETEAGQALNLDLSAAANVGGFLTYYLIGQP